MTPVLEIVAQVRSDQERDWGYLEVFAHPENPENSLLVRRHDAPDGNPVPADVTVTIAEAPLLAEALMLVVNKLKGQK